MQTILENSETRSSQWTHSDHIQCPVSLPHISLQSSLHADSTERGWVLVLGAEHDKYLEALVPRRLKLSSSDFSRHQLGIAASTVKSQRASSARSSKTYGSRNHRGSANDCIASQNSAPIPCDRDVLAFQDRHLEAEVNSQVAAASSSH